MSESKTAARKEAASRAGEKAQWVMSLLCKNRDLSWDPSAERRQVRMEEQLASLGHAPAQHQRRRTSELPEVLSDLYTCCRPHPILVPIQKYCWAGEVANLLMWLPCSHRYIN